MLKEFKEFAVKGNVIDLAVGVVIGGAFGKIVTSMVSDIIMPIAGILTGGVNFKSLKFVLKEGQNGIEAVTLNYGQFIQNVVDFLIISFAIFIFIKLINKFKIENEKATAAKAEAVLSNQEKLLMEIRDSIRNIEKQN